jgi:long-chain acyl-CoA synthetase
VQAPWTSHYPPGVPAHIRTGPLPTLAAVLEDAFQRYAKRDAAVCMDTRLTYRDIDQLSEALGAWLQSLGLERGTRVAIMMPNVPQYLVALAAVLRVGFTVVNVNPLYTARELQHQLADAGATVAIVLENFATTLEEVIDHTPVRHVVLASMGDLLGFWRGRLVNFAVRHLRKMVPEFRLPLDEGRTVTRFQRRPGRRHGPDHAACDIRPDDVAFLQYTGGTTGVSKGAVLLHRNVVANILQRGLVQADARPVGDRPLTIVCALPLYHIFALTICALMGAHWVR